MIIVVMGVSGSGKTTVGSLLARDLNFPFFDADDFHSAENRAKMSQGIPLTDEDRADWLQTLRALLLNIPHGVLACSALKRSYRHILAIHDQVHFVYLKGAFEQVESRLKKRTDHYMPVKLLASQFEALEEPEDALIVDIAHTPEDIIAIIRKGLHL